MSDPFYAPQTQDNLPVSASMQREGNEWYFKLLGRNGSAPPLILSQQKPLVRGTQAVLVRFRLRCDLNYPSGASNQGVAVRLRVLQRRNGVSEDPHMMYDSSPENTTATTTWYRDRHSDVREVTRVIQMPEEVIGGTHIDVGIFTRGSNGSADIFGPVEIRNMFSRVYSYKFGATVVADASTSDREFAKNFASPLFGGRTSELFMKQFSEKKATIPVGRPIQVSARMFINLAAVTNQSTGAAYRFSFSIGIKFEKRTGGFDWISFGVAPEKDGRLEVTDYPLEISQSIIATADYIKIRPAWFFFVFDPGGTEQFLCSINQEGFTMEVRVDDAVESSS